MKVYNCNTNYIYNQYIVKTLVSILKEEYYDLMCEDILDGDITDLDLQGILEDIKDSLNNLQSGDITPPFTDQNTGNTIILDRHNGIKYEAYIKINDKVTDRRTIRVIISTIEKVLADNGEMVLKVLEFGLNGMHKQPLSYICGSKFDID